MDNPSSDLFGEPAVTKLGLDVPAPMAGLIERHAKDDYPSPLLSGVVPDAKVNMSWVDKIKLMPVPKSATQYDIGMVALEKR